MSSSGILGFVVQNKVGQVQMLATRGSLRIDHILLMSSSIFDKVFHQFSENLLVEKHFQVDDLISVALFISEQCKSLSNPHSSNKGECSPRVFFINFQLVKQLMAKALRENTLNIYQPFVNENQRYFQMNSNNKFLVTSQKKVSEKNCDREVLNIKFQETLNSKFQEEKDLLIQLPYKYAKKKFQKDKNISTLERISQKHQFTFCKLLNQCSYSNQISKDSPIMIPQSNKNSQPHGNNKIGNCSQLQSKMRNKMYSYAFQMKIKSDHKQNENCSKIASAYLNNNNNNQIKVNPSCFIGISSRQFKEEQEKMKGTKQQQEINAPIFPNNQLPSNSNRNNHGQQIQHKHTRHIAIFNENKHPENNINLLQEPDLLPDDNIQLQVLVQAAPQQKIFDLL